MFPTVVIRQPGQTPIHLSVREPIEIGRECTGVILVDPRVSRRHLVLAPMGDRVAVLDLCSSNGTTLHGRRLEIEMELMAGQFIKLGDTTITVVDERAESSARSRRGARAVSRDADADLDPDLHADDGELATTVLPAASGIGSLEEYRHDLDVPPLRAPRPPSEWSRHRREGDSTSRPVPRDQD